MSDEHERQRHGERTAVTDGPAVRRVMHDGLHPDGLIAEYCRFLASLRGTGRFDEIAAEARRLTAAFKVAEVAA